ncbi:MAG: LytTR family DNA-binding domain-containing protein [Bryobacteraceae bacterium]|jgi:DNA-binding LytR/AlgR family response regulator
MSACRQFQVAHPPPPPAYPKDVRQPAEGVIQVSEPWGSVVPLRTLIVDDEPIARRILREELESVDSIEIVGEVDNGATAVDRISSQRPDLVLLDLQMPVMGGLDVIRSIRRGTHIPVVVIVTAYDKYALEAFEAGAIDYLLKPVGRERLIAAIERAKRLTGREAVERLAHLQEIARPREAPLSRKIVGKVGEEYFLLSADEILAFQADGDLVWIVSTKRRYLATQTLKVLEQRLHSTSFRRIHRNALVNVDHVRKMSALSSQRWLITLNNDQEFIVSKRQARSVRELLHW